MLHWYVYILKSISKNFLYVGSTNDWKRRLFEHNSGMVQSTKAYRPLRIVAYVAVETERKARELEQYFKTGSGKAILKKRILTECAPSGASSVSTGCGTGSASSSPDRRSPTQWDVVGPSLSARLRPAMWGGTSIGKR